MGLQATILEGELVLLFAEEMHGIRNATMEAILADMKVVFPAESYSLCIGNRTEAAEKVYESYNDAKIIISAPFAITVNLMWTI
ncbi:MAG: hypothetical protein JSY10_11285 [Paenibacillus sp.]|nr:hypothetical protein [Paenibacillus sp.]